MDRKEAKAGMKYSFKRFQAEEGKMYKKGDIVKIYEDPITCQKLEGYAKIIRVESESRNQYAVKFLDFHPTVLRFIMPILTPEEKTQIAEKVKADLTEVRK